MGGINDEIARSDVVACLVDLADVTVDRFDPVAREIDRANVSAQTGLVGALRPPDGYLRASVCILGFLPSSSVPSLRHSSGGRGSFETGFEQRRAAQATNPTRTDTRPRRPRKRVSRRGPPVHNRAGRPLSSAGVPVCLRSLLCRSRDVVHRLPTSICAHGGRFVRAERLRRLRAAFNGVGTGEKRAVPAETNIASRVDRLRSRRSPQAGLSNWYVLVQRLLPPCCLSAAQGALFLGPCAAWAGRSRKGIDARSLRSTASPRRFRSVNREINVC